MPSFLGIKCDSLRVIAHADFEVYAPGSNNGKFPSTALYKCNVGYENTGANAAIGPCMSSKNNPRNKCASGEMTCSTNGTWVGNILCTDRQSTCTDQSTDLKGQVGGPGTCKCKAGFTGTPTWDGKTWNNPCVGKPCDAVPSVANATSGKSSNGNKYPSRVSYQCKTGFKSVGTTLIKECQSNLRWKGDVICSSGQSTCSGTGQSSPEPAKCECDDGYEGSPSWLPLRETWNNPCQGI